MTQRPYAGFPVGLAPMAGVTELPFRTLCREMGCALTFTEMVSAKGFLYENERTLELLETAEGEHPCGFQLFGADPAAVAEAARRIGERYAGRVDLIDLNMGCPAHKIAGAGEGSALMRDLPLAGRIIEAAAKAVPLPVTVKFRKGWDEHSVNAVEFARMAQESGAAALCVHGRTRAQGYSGRADWDIIGSVKAAVRIPVLGNGDLFAPEDVLRMKRETGCDGVLIARGALGNPWIFRACAAALAGEAYAPPAPEERVDTALRHAAMQQAYKGAHAVIEMRKHVAWYLHGLPGAAKLRAAVNACTSLEELRALLLGYLRSRTEA